MSENLFIHFAVLLAWLFVIWSSRMWMLEDAKNIYIKFLLDKVKTTDESLRQDIFKSLLVVFSSNWFAVMFITEKQVKKLADTIYEEIHAKQQSGRIAQ